jgi:hypothetical protein
MVDLLLAGAAVVVLLIVAVALVRSDRVRRGWLAAAVAVIVLAAGTFAVALYRSQTDKPDETPAAAPTQGLGAAVLRVEIPMGTGDKLPQGALWLDPPRPGTDAYTGDVSLLCSTPGKAESAQNCTGDDRRAWTVEPLSERATVGPATGDPFADPKACSPSNGVAYQGEYLELAADRSYCLRRKGDDTRTYAIRVPAFPAEKPLPAKLIVEVAVL